MILAKSLSHPRSELFCVYTHMYVKQDNHEGVNFLPPRWFQQLSHQTWQQAPANLSILLVPTLSLELVTSL